MLHRASLHIVRSRVRSARARLLCARLRRWRDFCARPRILLIPEKRAILKRIGRLHRENRDDLDTVVSMTKEYSTRISRVSAGEGENSGLRSTGRRISLVKREPRSKHAVETALARIESPNYLSRVLRSSLVTIDPELSPLSVKMLHGISGLEEREREGKRVERKRSKRALRRN